MPVFLHLVLLIIRFAHIIHLYGQVLFPDLTLEQLNRFFVEEEGLF